MTGRVRIVLPIWPEVAQQHLGDPSTGRCFSRNASMVDTSSIVGGFSPNISVAGTTRLVIVESETPTNGRKQPGRNATPKTWPRPSRTLIW